MKIKLELINRILVLIASIIGATIVIATLTALAVTKGIPGKNYRKADPDPQKVTNMNKGKENAVDAFTDFRQIRVQTKVESEEEEPTVIVVCPWFSYPSGDKALFEELSQKERQIRSIFINYFSERTSREILEKGEGRIKEDLLEIINGQLVMGKIRAVYFNDYIFID
ncbi:MAG: flagellar basal body-associated FliL family protein [Spirochaetales bacterium]|nr:flagellar basal body-associated FliL family protein [Spirochaetales bacterium]